jgi:alginate O-acetyltransferase complex protein AlgI
MEVVHLMQRRGSVRQMLARRPVYVRWAIYYIAVMALIQLNTSSIPLELRRFIYFQF